MQNKRISIRFLAVLRAAYQANGSDVDRSEQAGSCLRRPVSSPPMAQGLTSGGHEMMDKETIEKAIAGMPEAFYNGLAYIIPAGYQTLGIMFNLLDLRAMGQMISL